MYIIYYNTSLGHKYFVKKKKDLTETEQVVLDYSLTSSSSMMKQS